MENKLLSIIIPVYNSEEYIKECLKSLTLLPDTIEILVINDGSTDNTAEAVEKYMEADNRIRLFNTPNGGVSRARNIGLDKAEGKYLLFLDADDYLLSDGVERVLRSINDDNCDFTAFSRRIIERNGKEWDQNFSFQGLKTDDEACIDKIMYADSMFNECWGKIYRHEIVDKYNISFPIGVPIGEDLMFVMEYYSHCISKCAYNIPLVGYRQHGGSAMRKYCIADRMSMTENLYNYAKAYLPENLKDENSFYNMKILTSLCREYCSEKSDSKAIKTIYLSEMTANVVSSLKEVRIPVYRMHEYIMMKYKLYGISALYYHMKSKLG